MPVLGFVLQLIFAVIFALLAVVGGTLTLAVESPRFQQQRRFGYRNKITTASTESWVKAHRAAKPFSLLAGALSLIDSLAISLMFDPNKWGQVLTGGIGGLLLVLALFFFASQVATKAAKAKDTNSSK